MPRRRICDLEEEIIVLNKQVDALAKLANDNNQRAVVAETQVRQFERAHERLRRVAVLHIQFLSETDLP